MAYIGQAPTPLPLTATDIPDLPATKITSGTFPALDGSNLTGISAGKVLQVVQATNTSQTDTSSSSFVATGLSVDITPSSSSNKVLVIVMGVLDNETSGSAPRVTIYRDSSNIGVADGLSRNYATSRLLTPLSMSKLDTPSTSSQITYSVRIRSATSNTVRFGETTQQTIIAMEIQG